MKRIFGAIATVLGIALLLLGIGALVGNNWAESQVKHQLAQEKIDMPDDKGIAAIEDAGCRDELNEFKGEKLETGPQAKAYADCYIWQHMMKSSKGKVYQDVSGDQRTLKAKLTEEHGKDVAAWPDDAKAQLKAADDLKTSTFQGDALRGMLLNAYAWWTFAQIAKWVGIASLIAGPLLALLGWLLMRRKKDHVETVHTAPVTTTRTTTPVTTTHTAPVTTTETVRKDTDGSTAV